MKKELIIGICLLAAIIAGLIYFVPGQQGMTAGIKNEIDEQPSPTLSDQVSNVAGRISHNLALNPSAAMVGDTKKIESILVYKTLPPVVNNETTLEYAKKFNVTGTLRGGQVVQSKDLRYGVEISKTSGSVRYADQNRPNEQMDVPENLPTDDEAVKIATQFLKDRDLYPEGAANPTIYRENTYSAGNDNKVFYGQIGVWYHRMLNGLKVEGTQLVVYVGGHGDVIGYYANWRDYEPYKECPLITPQDAFDKLKAKGVPVGMKKPDSLVSIDDVRLAYKTKAGAYSEEYLEPVWVFKGYVVDGKAADFIETDIPALTDEAVNSLSSS